MHACKGKEREKEGRKEGDEIRKAEREKERKGKKERKAPSAGQVSIPGDFTGT